MAPVVKNLDITETALSPSGLDTRSSISPANLAEYLSGLSLSQREALVHSPESVGHISKRSNDLSLSPTSGHSLLTLRARSTMNPAAGSIPPDALNMKG